ncbi:MAG: glycerophosphodiester phosphodiesterase, partial [Bacteroidota bacterium]|nr:glycerophosphodiester phosphodiesterase [Bacteroidota bacterium]
AIPDIPITFRYARLLNKSTPFEIVSHHGGQNADLLPASENSVEIIKLASRFGATGIELDVRMTSDGVPVLFHDPNLNERAIQKNGLVGPIENYSFAQLSALVRLLHGEHLPSLDEALAAVVYNTSLRYVWLDMKVPGPLVKVRELQAAYLQKATTVGRNVSITIGIPDQSVLDKFKTLPNYTSIPSVNELTPEDVQSVNSSIWGPRFTLGLQSNEVATMHAQGRKVYVWTIDIEQNIKEYLYNGQFDGMISSYPSAVAYYYYAKK